jgi:hypothetical protein
LKAQKKPYKKTAQKLVAASVLNSPKMLLIWVVVLSLSLTQGSRMNINEMNDNEIKNSIVDIGIMRDALNRQIDNLQHAVIQRCKHTNLLSLGDDSLRYPWDSNKRVMCQHCGLSVNGSNTGVPDTALLSLKDSMMVRPINGSKTERTYVLSIEAQYALSLPKRFTEQRLRELFSGSPFPVEDVLRNSRSNYVVDENALINNYQDFSSQFYGDD